MSPWPSLGEKGWTTFSENRWTSLGENGWPALGENAWTIIARKMTLPKPAFYSSTGLLPLPAALRFAPAVGTRGIEGPLNSSRDLGATLH